MITIFGQEGTVRPLEVAAGLSIFHLLKNSRDFPPAGFKKNLSLLEIWSFFPGT